MHVSPLLSVGFVHTIVVFLFMQMWSVWPMSVAIFTLVTTTLGHILLNPFMTVVALLMYHMYSSRVGVLTKYFECAFVHESGI